MFDTLNLRIDAYEVGATSLIEEISPHLDEITGQHFYPDGNVIVTGKLGSLGVSVGKHRVKVFNNSFAKYHFGDCYSVMGRKDMQQCIERLSDGMHLDMRKSEVCRLDFGQNFVMKEDMGTYIGHLGERPRAVRLPQKDGLYYKSSNNNIQMVFYDKNREQNRKGNPIPELYKNRKVLRYEYRFLHRLPKELGVDRVTADLLYNEEFYMRLVDDWRKGFEEIEKINDTTMNFDIVRTKKELYRAGLLFLIEQRGGKIPFSNSIVEAAKVGKITPKQKHDLLKAIGEACKLDGEGLVVANEAIKELEEKVKRAARFYR